MKFRPRSLLIFAATVLAAASAEAKDETAAVLHQYTSSGHVLGFAAGGYVVSDGTYVLKVEFVGATAAVPIGEAAGSAARGGAAPLGRVTYEGLWEGISVRYDAPEDGIARSTWHLEPGAKPSAIRLRYNRPVRLNADGTLTLEADGTGLLRESAPLAWQDVDGQRRPVEVAFAARGGGDLGFEVGAYDNGRPLVIDPTLAWNTFLGGSGADVVYGIAVGAGGEVYVTGHSTATWGVPVRTYTAGYDAFVARLDTSSGALQWNTFLGDAGDDLGQRIQVDGGGNVYLSGYSTAAWGSPVRPYSAAFDAFAARLDAATGALQWSTFLGGSADDFGRDIALDGSGKVYVSGYSGAAWGTPVRPYSSADDAFAARLDASSGVLEWNTFLGGSGDDLGFRIAVDGSGKAYLTGYSDASWGTPVRAFTANWDVFAAQLNTASGMLQWNTFLGGSGSEAAWGIAVDGSGRIYVAGYGDETWGTPVRAYTADLDAFAAGLDAVSGALQWNTFLGDSGNDFSSIATGGSGSVYAAGNSGATWGSPEHPFTAGADAFVARLDASSGALQWNTFLGGSGDDGAVVAPAIDGSGTLFAGGGSDTPWGSPVRAYTAGQDAFVARLGPVADKDFYVRDWTDNPGSHDLGEEPSTHYQTNWAWTSDVWNRGTNSPGSPTNGWYPTDNMFAGAGTLGDNWGFVRIHRNAPGSAAAVTAEILVSEFGAGSNFVPVTTTTLSFAPSDTALTKGAYWHRDPTLSNHACIAVQISAATDPFQSPGLAGHSPGDPNGQLLILSDNNKAQRNLSVSHNVPHLAAIQYALIHNPGFVRKDTVLRYESPAAGRLNGAQVEVVGGRTVDFRSGGRIVLEGMQPGENRWIALRFAVPAGDPVAVHFYEMDGGREVNAFTLQAQPVSLAAAIRDNLRYHVQVFNRLAAAFAVQDGRREAQSAERLLRQREFGAAQYRSFLQRARTKGIAALLTRLVEQAPPGFTFDVLRALEDLGNAANGDREDRVASSHSVLLHRLDAFATMLQKSQGDTADILQMVRWQQELYRTRPVLGELGCSPALLRQSAGFISAYGRRNTESYRALLRALSPCFRQTARAFEMDRQRLERTAIAMERRGLSLAALEKAHRSFLLALQDAAGTAQN